MEKPILSEGGTMTVICFHNPDEENGYLSNWYTSPFTVSGINFSSVEQYMMYQKAVCFAMKRLPPKFLTVTMFPILRSLEDLYRNATRIIGTVSGRLLFMRDSALSFYRMRSLKRNSKQLAMLF